nr:hypothetical protein CFP56_62854 [Quercus suber]
MTMRPQLGAFMPFDRYQRGINALDHLGIVEAKLRSAVIMFLSSKREHDFLDQKRNASYWNRTNDLVISHATVIVHNLLVTRSTAELRRLRWTTTIACDWRSKF